MKKDKTLPDTIIKKKWDWMGHIIGEERISTTVLEGTVEMEREEEGRNQN